MRNAKPAIPAPVPEYAAATPNTGDGDSDATSLGQIQDPWELLGAVRPLDLPDRQEYVPHFIALVSKLKKIDRDALLAAGREVFKYRMESAREALLEIAEAGNAKSVPTLATEEFLADMAYDPSRENPLGFLVHQFARPDDPPQWVDKIKVGSKTYYPRDFGPKLMDRACLFPSGYEEYGSEAELRDEIRQYIRRHLQLDAAAMVELVGVYGQYCWIAELIDVAPYLRAIGDFAGGKSTLLRVVGSITSRPTFAAGAATAAPLFRVIDATNGGTLLVDEADFDKRSDEWEMINKILLTGHTRGPVVLRAEKSLDGGFDVQGYDCFGPKVLGMRKPFKDPALESRCVNVPMSAGIELDPNIPLFGDAVFRAEARRLRNKLQLWRFRRYRNVAVNPRERIAGLDPRLNAIALPLLATTDDPVHRKTIIKLVQDYGTVIRELRRDSAEGFVAQAVVDVWAARVQSAPGPSVGPVEFPLSAVTERVRLDLTFISPERVSSIVRLTLGLKTQHRGGRAHLAVAAPQVNDLARRYGVSVPRTPVR